MYFYTVDIFVCARVFGRLHVKAFISGYIYNTLLSQQNYSFEFNPCVWWQQQQQHFGTRIQPSLSESENIM